MADAIKLTNFPPHATQESVALELYQTTKNMLPDAATGKGQIEQRLKLYVACLNAVVYSKVDLSDIT